MRRGGEGRIAGFAGLSTVTPTVEAKLVGELGLHDPTLDLRDEAVFLLHAAAEVEHALLVQYLYAAYSLRASGGATAPARLPEWRMQLLQVAREEMCHFISVQNLLRLIGGPLNFEREDFPFRSEIYPFMMKLEPLTIDSVAKYVSAEMPKDLANRARNDTTGDPKLAAVRHILDTAQAANGGYAINQVGFLFSRLMDIFSALSEDVFRIETVGYLARAEDWAIRRPANEITRFLVLPKLPDHFDAMTDADKRKTLKAGAQHAIEQIALQGEGDEDPTTGDQSHYDIFRSIYDDALQTPGFPRLHTNTADYPGWMFRRTTNVNTFPLEVDLLPELAQGRIADPITRAWAQLSNLRYRSLLAYLSHYLQWNLPETRNGNEVSARYDLREWVFVEMYNLRAISERLGALNEPSGLPFELPYTLELPNLEPDRWQTHIDVITACRRLILDDLHGPGADGTLQGILEHDDAARQIMEKAKQGHYWRVKGGDGQSPEERLIALIREKKSVAVLHRNLQYNVADGQVTLDTLFDDTVAGNEHFARLLDLLKTHRSVRDATRDEPLVKPGNPDESIFYWNAANTNNVNPLMGSAFTEDQRKTIADWIESLAVSVSFQRDIRPLFRDSDVSVMHAIAGFDLSKYEDVRTRAERIYDRLADQTMPCDAPWPQDQIDRFRKWIDDGLQP
jgi:hypothetical protein